MNNYLSGFQQIYLILFVCKIKLTRSSSFIIYLTTWEEKTLANGEVRIMRYSTSLFYCLSLLKQSSYQDLRQYTMFYVYHVKHWKLLLLSLLRRLQKTHLTKQGTVFDNWRGTWPRILSQTLDCHSVPVMTIKFFNLQFEFNSSVSHLEMMIACNAQQSQENSDGWERDHHTWVRTSSARYIPLISELRKSFSVLNNFSLQKFGLEIIQWKTTLPMYVWCIAYTVGSRLSE